VTRSLLMLYQDLADHCRSNRLGMACIDGAILACAVTVIRMIAH
jgi:hypothetical protein